MASLESHCYDFPDGRRRRSKRLQQQAEDERMLLGSPGSGSRHVENGDGDVDKEGVGLVSPADSTIVAEGEEEDMASLHKTVSTVRDFLLLFTLSSATCLVIISLVFGVDKLWLSFSEKEVLPKIGLLLLFILIMTVISYLLLKMALHYVLYVLLGVLLSIIWPCSPSKVKRIQKRMYDKAT